MRLILKRDRLLYGKERVAVYDLIGERIRQVRIHNQLKQKEFAQRLFVTSSYISKVETGKEIPTKMFIRLVSYEYGVSYEWLLAGTGFVSVCESISTPEEAVEDQKVEQVIYDFQQTIYQLNEKDKKQILLLVQELTHILKNTEGNFIEIISRFICSYSRFVDILNCTDMTSFSDVKRLETFLYENQTLDIASQIKEIIETAN